MGTCYGKRSACYDLTRNYYPTPVCELKCPETPAASLRRFSSLRHSVKSFSSVACQRRSLRTKPMAIVQQSPNNKHWCIIKYDQTEEKLV